MLQVEKVWKGFSFVYLLHLHQKFLLYSSNMPVDVTRDIDIELCGFSITKMCSLFSCVRNVLQTRFTLV